ncbi:MAG: metalloregulator ArsR/SmtB family transcription factor [Thermoproteaceae archaeon]|jgi:DNA-binding transcriptional ArsR family regulator|nr:metalloregulator ArsR/SmtB family transcription factor [Thermoproteaceae archaeon]
MGGVIRLSEVARELARTGVCKDPPALTAEEVSLPPETIDRAAETLAALAEPNRLKILYLLRQSSMPVCFLSYILGLDRSLVSHHLARLRALGLVEISRSGRYNVYSLSAAGRLWADAVFSALPAEIGGPACSDSS